MSYFNYFREVAYTFGSGTTSPSAFQDLSVYADVIDQIKDSVTAYSFYTILEGDRPDTVSRKLYGDPEYHWTFFLMNDHLRESGWPLTRMELRKFVDEKYTGSAIVTRDDFWGSIVEGTNVAGRLLRIGDTLTGSLSATIATVTNIDPDNGQIFTNTTNTWRAGEQVRWRDADNVLRTITVHSSTSEKNAIDHYEDDEGNYVDINPRVGAGALLLEVTLSDMVNRINENQKQIKIIRPSYVKDVVTALQQALEG